MLRFAMHAKGMHRTASPCRTCACFLPCAGWGVCAFMSVQSFREHMAHGLQKVMLFFLLRILSTPVGLEDKQGLVNAAADEKGLTRQQDHSAPTGPTFLPPPQYVGSKDSRWQNSILSNTIHSKLTEHLYVPGSVLVTGDSVLFVDEIVMIPPLMEFTV